MRETTSIYVASSESRQNNNAVVCLFVCLSVCCVCVYIYIYSSKLLTRQMPYIEANRMLMVIHLVTAYVDVTSDAVTAYSQVQQFPRMLQRSEQFCK